MSRNPEYDYPPFRENVVLKKVPKKSIEDWTLLYVLENSPVTVKRFIDENFPEKLKFMHAAYDMYANNSYLKIPHYLPIRANVFDNDHRFNTHYLLKDEIAGQNIQNTEIPEAELDQAEEVMNAALIEFTAVIRKIYLCGGIYDRDQQMHQFVYGKAEEDQQPKLYFVDLEHNFLAKYDATDRSASYNEVFFESILAGCTQLCEFLESKFFKHPLLARAEISKLLKELIELEKKQNKGKFVKVIQKLLSNFETAHT